MSRTYPQDIRHGAKRLARGAQPHWENFPAMQEFDRLAERVAAQSFKVREQRRMIYRIFTIASCISAALLGVALLLSIATCIFNPWEHRVTLTDQFYVGVWRGFSGDTLGRIVLFNDAEYGPYRGSIIQFTDDAGNVHPEFERRIALGDSFGVYYRYFRVPSGATLWTLMVSLWYPVALFAVLPTAWLWMRRRRRKLGSV